MLLKADKPRKQTKSGILISEDWKTLPPKGEVLAVGPLVKQVKPGDRVLFERYASIILENDERLCKEGHIFGMIDD